MNDQKVNKFQYWWSHVSKHFSSEGSKYVNPYRMTCPSGFAFDVIEDLGLNRWHSLEQVVCATKHLMTRVAYDEDLTQWDAFYINTPKETTAEARLENIVYHLPYQVKDKLSSMGCSIEKQKKGGTVYMRLRTHSVKDVPTDTVDVKCQKTLLERFLGAIKMIVGFFHW